MLSEIQCKNIIEKVVDFSAADETECLIQSGQNALTRFANNGIYQNVSEIETLLSLRVGVDNKMGRFTTNCLDDKSLKDAVDSALSIAPLMQPERDLLPMLKPRRLRVSIYQQDLVHRKLQMQNEKRKFQNPIPK